MAIGLVTALPIILVFMFAMQDMDKVMNSTMPAIEVMYQATGSRTVTIVMSVLLILVYAS